MRRIHIRYSEVGRKITAVGLVSVALMIGACGGTASDTTTPAVDGGTAVSIDAFAFSPATITVKVGTEVTWRNLQANTHTVTADDAEFDSAQLPQDAEFSQTFDTPGEFSYHCEIHPNMTGTVIVEP